MSVKLILERRRRYVAGEFDRKITERWPINAILDECTLSCGHTAFSGGTGPVIPDTVGCSTCADEWVPAEGEAAAG